MSLGISSSVYPIANLAAIFAIGKPVALDASADDRDTRGFISITITRPSTGLTANWMLQPPVSTPTSRITAMPMSRSRWNSLSVNVIDGATVMESPVCTPIGSRFSIEQTTTTLSLRSRISSSSYSFQPRIDSSSRTSVVGLACSPAPAMRRSSCSSWAKPDPRPPMVNDGRTTSGYPSSSAAASTSLIECATTERADSAPQRSTTPLKACRSSPSWIAATSAPISSTPYLASTPLSCRAIAALRAVCPPSVASTASGRSVAMIASITSGVIGSTYVASANSGSVMIVAGLELTSTTRNPSSRSTRQACVPE